MKRITKSIDFIMKRIIKSIDFILFFLMILLTLTVFIQVISRFIYPIPWSEEFAKINLMWIVYLGLVNTFYYDKHIRIDLIDGFIHSTKLKKVISFIFYDLLGLILGVYLTLYSYELFQSQLHSEQTTSILQWPMYFITIPFIIGSILTGVYFVISILKFLIKAFTKVRPTVKL